MATRRPSCDQGRLPERQRQCTKSLRKRLDLRHMATVWRTQYSKVAQTDWEMRGGDRLAGKNQHGRNALAPHMNVETNKSPSFPLLSPEDSRIDLRGQRMNDTQHKSGIVEVLQRFRDSDFLQKSVPLLGAGSLE